LLLLIRLGIGWSCWKTRLSDFLDYQDRYSSVKLLY
jgi:hypothetical protein